MMRSLSICLVLALAACGPKKDGASPPNDPYPTPEPQPVAPEPTSDPTGKECTARCLESDRYADQSIEARESSCAAECPAEPGAAADAEAADAEAANAEGGAGSPAEGG